MLAEFHGQRFVRAYEDAEIDLIFSFLKSHLPHSLARELPLATVNRKVPQKPCLLLSRAEYDRLARPIGDIDAEACGEHFLDVEALRHSEVVSGDLKAHDPVKSINTKTIPLDAVSYYVPAFCKFLYGIGPQGICLRLRAGVFLISDRNLMILRHCLHHCGQVVMARRNVLYRNPARESLFAQGEHVVDGECVDEPCRCRVLVCDVS